MSDYFPDELWVQIFARLPVKSLIRFRAVCKSWYSLITNPSFIATHLDRTIADSKTSGGKLLLRYFSYKDNREHYFLCRDQDEKFGDEKLELDFPFKTKYGYFRIVGTCKGLLCICDACLSCLPDDFTTIIGNPSIREWVTLPRPPRPQCRPYEVVLGFGAHTTSHEYKVVRIVYAKDEGHRRNNPPEVHIYAQSTGSWRGIGSLPLDCKAELLWSQVFLNGTVHWLVNNPSVGGGFHRSIITFDMDDEVFCEMAVPPPALHIQPSTSLSITSFGESLALLLCGAEMGERGCRLWVMKDYGVAESWCKLYSVIYPPKVMCRTLAFRKNGEALLTNDGWLVSHDPVSETSREIGIKGGSYSFRVDTFMESLLLLKGQDGGFEG